MSRHAAVRRLLPLVLAIIVGVFSAGVARAYGPRGFDTVVIDAGHGGFDRGGGPGQAIAEKPYTLDTARRLERELRRRGFRTVMTRTDDVFVSLPERVAIANSYSNAVFVSVHYNSAPRYGAHGFETYFYRSDSLGLAERLHQAQLATLNTDDRRVRRRGFYVIRRTRIPSVLCEGGFLTNPEESRIVLNSSYRQRWAENIANALAAQRREGNPGSSFYRSRYATPPPDESYESSTMYEPSAYAPPAPVGPQYLDESSSHSSRRSSRRSSHRGRSHRYTHTSRGGRGRHRTRGSSRGSSHSHMHKASGTTHRHHRHSR